ncbi:hypothetical protein ONZ45_g15401 [Pleurotus djamor]|nr:hypothetical protein ONZ45_g15401 [Pleurotus djamor]
MSNPTSRSVGIPTSHNRPPPPRLGMRGPPTLSQQQRTTSSSTTTLPMKQRSFKVPLLPKQPQNVALMGGTNAPSSSRSIPNAAAVVSSSKPPASGLPKKLGRDTASSSNQVVASSAHEPARSKSPPVPIPAHMDDADDECEEGDTHGDSSFGDISLEWDDEFEKVMSTYD